jgi:hypothetical protein
MSTTIVRTAAQLLVSEFDLSRFGGKEEDQGLHQIVGTTRDWRIAVGCNQRSIFDQR